MSANSTPAPPWVSYSDSDLLKVRIKDLKLKIEDSDLAERIQQLHNEIDAKGLKSFKPQAYLGDEWFSPEGDPIIAVPFYLAHPRLMTLEKNLMLEVEGGTPESCMKLLRHEAGHCFDHAYKFSKRRKWKQIFGDPAMEYNPETYHPRPYSRSFVEHIENWYAQSHPDEDFAETFAVWLSPSTDWKVRYAKWPGALKKLQYIEELAQEVAGKTLIFEKMDQVYSANKLTSTLDSYYKKRVRENAQQYPDFYDHDLIRIFGGAPTLSKREFGAARFLKRNRKIILDSVSIWTGEKKFTIDRLLRKLESRCEVLDLRLGKGETQTALEVAAYLATLVTNYLFTGKFKRSV